MRNTRRDLLARVKSKKKKIDDFGVSGKKKKNFPVLPLPLAFERRRKRVCGLLIDGRARIQPWCSPPNEVDEVNEERARGERPRSTSTKHTRRDVGAATANTLQITTSRTAREGRRWWRRLRVKSRREIRRSHIIF